MRGDHFTRGERHARRRHRLHPSAGHDLDRPLLERVLCIFAQVRLEHREDLVAGLDKNDARLLLWKGRIVRNEVRAVELGEGSRRLDAGRPASDHDDRQRTVVGELAVLVGRLPALEDVVLELDRVRQRVHGKRVLGSALRPEEVHLRPEGEHEEVVGDGREAVEADFLRLEIDPGDRRLVDRGVVLILDEIAERVSYRRRLEQPRRQLVKQRLEGVVVVLVYDDDVDVGVLQLPCGADPGEAAAENDDPRSLTASLVRHDARPTHWRSPRTFLHGSQRDGALSQAGTRSRPSRGGKPWACLPCETEGTDETIAFQAFAKRCAVNFW